MCGAGSVDRCNDGLTRLMPDLMPDLLEFEEPIGDPAEGDRGAVDAAADARSASARSRGSKRRIDVDARRALRDADAVAARAGGAPSDPADHARLRRAAVHRVRRDPRRPPLRRRPRDRRPARRCYHGAAGAGRRPSQGQRHQAEDLPQLRLRAARGLPQGAAGDAAGREVPAAGHLPSSTRRRPIPASSRRSAASPRRSPSTCARWRCSTCRSSSSCTAKAAAAARSASPSAIAS